MEARYTLPEITFVAGASQEVGFLLWTKKPNSTPFDANACIVNFSITNFPNRSGVPILSKMCEIVENIDGIPCIAKVVLEPLDTVQMHGKYVYQLTIIDPDGEGEIPGQGIIFMHKNIDQEFMRNYFA